MKAHHYQSRKSSLNRVAMSPIPELGRNHVYILEAPGGRFGVWRWASRVLGRVLWKEERLWGLWLPVFLWHDPLDPGSVGFLSSCAADHRDDLRFLCSQHRVQTCKDEWHHPRLRIPCNQQSPGEVWSWNYRSTRYCQNYWGKSFIKKIVPTFKKSHFIIIIEKWENVTK